MDIAAAEAAVRELGGQLVRQSTYKWYGTYVGNTPLPSGMTVDQLGKCEYAIKVPGSEWEIGLVKVGNKYQLALDYWGNNGQRLVEFVGRMSDDNKSFNPNKFKSAYTRHLQIAEAKRRGYMVQQTRVGNKTVLRLTK